ncbi:MAG: multidrug efflux SMR transporter [Anaerolineae bacterium]|jgi:small multidrug resistance pump
MHWVYLIAAILAEVGGTLSMKLSEGFTKLTPSILVFALYGISLGLLTLALEEIDVSVAYAIWSGVGMALIATVGVLWFKEPMTAIKIVSLGLIILGVAGLNLGDRA